MKRILKHLALLCLLASSAIVTAREGKPRNEETPLSLKDGKIIGLSKKYSPASFDLKKMSLSIGGKALVFPYALRSLLMYEVGDNPFFSETNPMKPHPYTYTFTSSWYHGIEGLPPYIAITVKLKDTGSYIRLLIDMDTLKFINADIHIKHIGDVPIALDRVPYDYIK